MYIVHSHFTGVYLRTFGEKMPCLNTTRQNHIRTPPPRFLAPPPPSPPICVFNAMTRSSDTILRTDSSTRQFTRTLLARYEGTSSLPSLEIPAFDLLLLCWKPGAISAIHDHPEAGCWVKVGLNH